jgi:chemotaxis protein methyltransferase CheR
LTGNILNEKQRPMVESRLRRRLIDLQLRSPSDYKTHWYNNLKEENKYLIGLLTTHFTSFFREFSHFEWLAEDLPSMVRAARAEGRNTLKFWSAACSKGQEVWSLCMWLNHHLPKIDPKMDWEVFGSDIDPESVAEAENGVYHHREIETAPRYLWEGFWTRGKEDISDWYRVKKVLSSHAKFATVNLLSINLPSSIRFDAIMCRNVLIYFDQDNQKKISTSLLTYLTPQGALITGMSESLNGFNLDIQGVFPSVYKKRQQFKIANTTYPLRSEIPTPLKVLCIDDSSTVVNILKKILPLPQFEVIGVATNGLEAIEKLKVLKPDVITLDLHMPVMDGPTFLQQSGVASKLPVIVVSSVERSDKTMLYPLFKLGVIDFVEKPTLQNMAQVGEELSQKLKMGWIGKKNNVTVVDSLSTNNKLPRRRRNAHIVFNVGIQDEKNLIKVLSEQNWDGDEITILVDSSSAMEHHFSHVASPYLKLAKNIVVTNNPIKVSKGNYQCIWLQFKSGNPKFLDAKITLGDTLILEENVTWCEKVKSKAYDISPITSFSYLINKLVRPV